MNDLYFNKFQNFWSHCSQNTNIGLERDIALNNAFLAMLEKWKSFLDKRSSFGALLIDLSTAFGCLLHELLIAKLHQEH